MTHLKRGIGLSVLAVLLAAGVCVSAGAADEKGWTPRKQVTLLAPAGAGGGLDMVARTMAKLFDARKIVTQPITVENKPGGGQVTGTVSFATQDAKTDH